MAMISLIRKLQELPTCAKLLAIVGSDTMHVTQGSGRHLAMQHRMRTAVNDGIGWNWTCLNVCMSAEGYAQHCYRSVLGIVLVSNKFRPPTPLVIFEHERW
jgi:hypothetical protein